MKILTVLVIALLPMSIFATDFNIDSLLIESVGGPEAVERIRSLKGIYESGTFTWGEITNKYEYTF